MPLTETILWADGFILVYSITDRNSFNYVKVVKQQLQDIRAQHQGGNHSNNTSPPYPVPLVLLGNKGDMVHLRQVAAEEGNECSN